MNDKKYLKWYNKVGYGSGDIAGNVVYALLSVFVMIYLTDHGRPQRGRDRHPHDARAHLRRPVRHLLRHPH